MAEHLILWKKWQDPIAPLVEGYQPEEDEDNPQFHKAIESLGMSKPLPKHSKLNKKLGPVVMGPEGIVPLLESNLPSVLFNFWMGHTNFGITHELSDIIANVPGVETLDIQTPYRFRIAVGVMFRDQDVRKAIDEAVKPLPEPQPPSTDPIDNVKTALRSRYKHWAIFFLPKGRMEVVGGATVNEVRSKAESYQAQAERTILSWERATSK